MCYGMLLRALGFGSVTVVERDSGKEFVEKVPHVILFKLGMLHNTWIGALIVRSHFIRDMLLKLSIAKGLSYDDPDSAALIPGYITAYDINVQELALPLEKFHTLNEFFFRQLNSAARPIVKPLDASVLVQPCDCRLMTYASMTLATQLWIKGKQFTIQQLLGDRFHPDWEDCSVAVCRLAPTDYHRFHMPCAATLTHVADIQGDYYSVKPIVVNSWLDVFGNNKRCVLEFVTPQLESFIMVIIGAAEVGSINIQKAVGETFDKGEELGYFAYGGSTILTLFKRGDMEFDADLVQRSLGGLETLVKVGTTLGHVVKAGGSAAKAD